VIWVLLGETSGDNAQLINLAQALGWPACYRRAADSKPALAWHRLHAFWSGAIPPSRQLFLAPPWPDLVLTCGGRALADVRRLRRLLGNKVCIVNLGRPWGSFRLFDCIITTPQYSLPPGLNVLENLFPLNTLPYMARRAALAQEWLPRWQHLPRPWTTCVVGGNSSSYQWTTRDVERLIERAQTVQQAIGGSWLVITSPRTPPDVAHRLQQAAGVGFLPTPGHISTVMYQACLALSDRFVVTADSASMIAEACQTNRPVHLFHPTPRKRPQRIIRQLLPQQLSSFLTSHGLGTPPRNLAALHRRLQAMGLLAPWPDEPQVEPAAIRVDGVRYQQAFAQGRSIDLERSVMRIRLLMGLAPRAAESAPTWAEHPCPASNPAGSREPAQPPSPHHQRQILPEGLR
jgi:mitochondrial fission protein ELM1